MPSKLEHALQLAAQGFRVFPLSEDNPNKEPKEIKKPAIKNWDTLATTDPSKIRDWWNNSDFNIGLATGRGTVVIDYDMKEGQLGQKALDTHDLLGLPMDGFRVDTPTGGVHLYFQTNREIRNSSNKIAKHVDIRGDGGYVVAPGSTIHGKPYTGRNGFQHELPQWMEKLATATRTSSTVDPKQTLSPLDKPSNIEAATRWIYEEAPEAIEGAGGDETTYKVACRVRDFGISQAECFRLMWMWNEVKASPPWTVEEIEQKVRNAYAYATLPAGIADPQGELGNVVAELSSLETKDDKKPNKLFWMGFQDSAGKALSSLGDPLVKGLLNRGGLSAIYGRSNSGKSFIVLNLEFHIAKGIDWQGRKVKKGLAIHLAAEGGQGFHKRTAALKKHHNTDENIPLVVVPCPINLLDKTREGDTHKLIAFIKEIEAAYGMPAEFIAIDTLSRALAGGDENAATDMGVFVQHIDKIRAATGAHVMLVHHSGKDQARGMRGWSGMQAAIDTEIEIHEGVLKITKQRDIEPLKPFKFQLKQIEIGQDSDGDQVTSCVVELAPENEFEISFDGEKGKLWKAIQGLTDKRRQNKSEDDTDRCILLSFSDIHDAYNVLRRRSQQETADKTYVSRLLKQIVSTGCLQKTEDDQWHM